MTARSFSFALPAGENWINANERLHWAPKARRTRYWRQRAALTARRLDLPRLERAQVDVTVHRSDARKYDAGNLQPTAKAIVDGIVDAGVLDDDDNAHLSGPFCHPGEKQPVRMLMVTVTELEVTP